MRISIIQLQAMITINYCQQCKQFLVYSPILTVSYRNHRKKLLHQQKERFKNKYREKGVAMLEKNKSLDHIESDGVGVTTNKDESVHLDPLVNSNKASFNKTKVPEDVHLEQWIDKRKGMSTVHQFKRKKLKTREKNENKVSHCCWTCNYWLSSTQSIFIKM